MGCNTSKSVNRLWRYLQSPINQEKKLSKPTTSSSQPIKKKSKETVKKFAIIGIACRFPGHSNCPDTYFSNLKNQKNCIVDIPNNRFNAEYYNSFHKDHPSKLVSKKAGMIDYFFEFDYKAFNISKREAQEMETQQRVLIECSLQALEDANIEYRGSKTGVFIGSSQSSFQRKISENSYYSTEYTSSGSHMAIQANRISYIFDLRGPSITVDTACASSGYAMYTAMSSIETGDCSQAIVGGIQVHIDPNDNILFGKLGALSPDGLSAPFDKSANGFVRSEGGAVVIIKPYKEAIKDGNKIYCILNSTAATCDGGSSPSLTKPSTIAQQDALKKALKDANVHPHKVFFWEAHATSTLVGDPTEANAFGEILGKGRKEENFLRIGSVKSNLGHTECAAYLASLIKCCLMLYKGVLLPNINYNIPNPKIEFNEYQMKVQNKCEEFNPVGKIMVVSSFGFGGANICTVVQGAEKIKNIKERRVIGPPYLFLTYARTKSGLENRIKQYKEFSEKKVKDQNRLMITLNTSKQNHYRFISFGIGNSYHKIQFNEFFRISESREPVCFVFSGQGAQYLKMGRELYQKFPVFREEIEKCDSIYKKFSGFSIVKDTGMFGSFIGKKEDLSKSKFALPSLVIIQVALLKFWKWLGIEPDCIIGHSLGEFTALYATGACDLETMLELLYARTIVVDSINIKGKMMAIGRRKEDVIDLISKHNLKDLYISANNSPKSCTIGGLEGSMLKLAEVCKERGVFYRILNISQAFHTPLLEEVRGIAIELFEKCSERINKPKITFISSVEDNDEKDGDFRGRFTAEYLFNNMLKQVKFKEAVQNALKKFGENLVFLEIAAHNVLSYSIKECGVKNIVHSLNRKVGEQFTILKNVGMLCTFKFSPQWDKLIGECERFEELPYYEYDREKCYIENEYFQQNREVIDRKVMPAMLGRKLVSCKETWQNYLSVKTYPFLRDHVVQRSIIFPAAGLIEIFMELFEGKGVMDFDIISSMNVPSDDSYLFVQSTINGEVGEVYSKREGLNQAWVLQSRAKILQNIPQKSKFKPKSIESYKKEFSDAVFEKRDVYERMKSINLNYGRSFQKVERIYQGDEECLAVVKTNAKALKNENWVIHPSTIDNFFQTFIGSVKSLVYTYLPQKMDKFIVYNNLLPELVYLHCKLTTKSKEYIKGDIHVFNSEGEVFVDIIGFKCQVLLEKENNFKNSYEYIWQTKDLPTAKPPLLKIDNNKDWKVVKSNLKIVDKVIADYLENGLDKVKEQKKDLPLTRRKYLEWADEFIRKQKSNDVELKDISTIPEFEIESKLIKRVGENLTNIQLNKNNDTAAVMFQDELLNNMYFKSISHKLVLDHFSKVFKIFLEDLMKEKRVIKILELGSGTGGLTRILLPLLKKYTGLVEYYFTDVTPSFLIDAKKLFRDSFLRFKVVDMNIPFSEQGLKNNSIDIIIGYDVIHVGKELNSCLENIHRCLVPNGFLILLELSNLPSYYDFVFGVFDGWLHFTDDRKKCYLNFEEWKKRLARSGYGEIVEVYDTRCNDEQTHQIVFAKKVTLLEEKKLDDVVIFSNPNPFGLVELIQTKIKEGWKENNLSIIIQTENVIDDTKYSEIHGIGKTLRNEMPNWNVIMVDFDKKTDDFQRKKVIDDVIKNPSKYEYDCLIRNNKIMVVRLTQIITKKDFTPPKDGMFQLEYDESTKKFQNFYVKRNVKKEDDVLVLVHSRCIYLEDYNKKDLTTNCISGTVVKVSSKVKNFKPGDEVFGFTCEGCGNYSISKEYLLSKRPLSLSFEECSSVPKEFLISYYWLVNKAGINKGQNIFINNGSSFLGKTSVQIISVMEANGYVKVSNEKEKEEFIKEFCSDKNDIFVFVKDDEIPKSVRFNLIMNIDSSPVSEILLKMLKPFGKFIQIENSDQEVNSLSLRNYSSNITFYSFNFTSFLKELDIIVDCFPMIFKRIYELFNRNLVKTLKTDIVKAEFLEKGIEKIRTKGRIILVYNNHKIQSNSILPIRDLYSSNKTYILSGGLGGIGFELCQYMSSKGARYIVLMSRSGRTSKYQNRVLSELKTQGVRVFVATADVTNQSNVNKMFVDMKKHGYPTKIGGIIHLAMVLSDNMLEKMDMKKYNKAIMPKKMGAINLIRRFKPGDLDFILFFSSISSIFGNPGQSNYVAGNVFLESWARNLVNRGFRAHTINLGPIRDVGFVSTNFKMVATQNWDIKTFLTMKQVNEYVERILRGDPKTVLYCPQFDFDYFNNVLGGHNYLFSHLIVFKEKEKVEISDGNELTFEDLNNVIKQLLMIDEDIDPEERLLVYGIDSIQSVELSQFLKDNYGIVISQMEILSGISMKELMVKSKIKNVDQIIMKKVKQDKNVLSINETSAKHGEIEFDTEKEMFPNINDEEVKGGDKSGNSVDVTISSLKKLVDFDLPLMEMHSSINPKDLKAVLMNMGIEKNLFNLRGNLKGKVLTVEHKGKMVELVDFGACAYLNTGELPELRKLVLDVYEKYGYNSHSTALFEPVFVKEVMENFYKIFGTKSCKLFLSTTFGSFDIIPSICDYYYNQVIVLIDKCAHNSLLRAVQLVDRSVPIKFTDHMDYEMVEKYCKNYPEKKIVYVNDGVFSMEGPNGVAIDPMRVYNLCKKYQNLEAFIDEAHGFGWVGKYGKGWFLSQIPGLLKNITCVCSLRKAVSGYGAVAVFGDDVKFERIRYGMPSYFFSTGNNPTSYAHNLAQTRFLLSKEYEKRTKYIHELFDYRNKLMNEFGLSSFYGHVSHTPVATLRVPGTTMNKFLEYFTKLFYEKGFYCLMMTYPSIPKGLAGIRFTTRACHTKEDVFNFLKAVKDLNEEFKK